MPTLVNLAERYSKSIAQVILRWHIQHGTIIFPKTSSEERLTENITVFDFELNAADMLEIDGFDAGRRLGAAPADGNWD
jgi:2,5-diketo-D-gluconate reductase A